MDMETKDMLQTIISGMEGMEGRITTRLDRIEARLDGHDEQLNAINTRFTKLEIKIENDVTKRIDALFDGYKLNHEKQWELERKVDSLALRLERLEAQHTA